MDAEMPTQQESIYVGSFNTSFTPQQFYRGDPWFVFVKDTLHLENIWNSAILFVFSITFNFSAITFLQDYHPTASLLDALRLFALSVAFTSLYIIYLLLPRLMAETFNTLKENRVIGNPRPTNSNSTSYKSIVNDLYTWTNGWWWLAIIAMISVVYLLFNVFIQRPHIPLFWNVLGFLVGDMPGVYIICFILVRVVLMLVFINRLFSHFTLQVKPLHADGSGGLGSLGHIGWISVGMMLAISLAILAVTQRLVTPVGIIIFTALYLIFILALVIGWLAIPHHWMLLARQEFLQDITNEYQQAVEETRPSLKGDTTAIEAGTKRLSALQDRYKLLRDNFPVWPLEIMQMRRLGVAFIVPALLSLLPSFLSLFTKR